MASAALAAAGCLGLLIYAGSGIPSRFPKELQNVVADFRNNPAEDARQYRCLYRALGEVGFAASCDGTDQPGTKRVVLWGDSHAAHLGPGLDELSAQGQLQAGAILLRRLPAGPCLSSATGKRRVSRFNEFVLRKIAELKPDTVIMAGRWEIYDGKAFRPRSIRTQFADTIARLKAFGVKRIVVDGPVPDLAALKCRNCARAIFASLPLDLRFGSKGAWSATQSFVIPTTYAANEMIQQAVAGTGAEFVSPLTTLCNDEGCLLVVPDSDGKPIYWDDNHFTRTGSIYFIEQNRAGILLEH